MLKKLKKSIHQFFNKKEEKVPKTVSEKQLQYPEYLTPNYVWNLFDVKRDHEAFALLEKYESCFTTENYGVTGEILLQFGYYDKALYYLEIAANEGDAISFQSIGTIYQHVLAYRDLDYALYCFKQSLKMGNKNALISLADIYIEEQEYLDFKKSKYYAEQAIENGFYIAYYYLGKYYAEHDNFIKAKELFSKLSEYEFHTSSEYGLSLLYYRYKNYDEYNPLKAKEIVEFMFNNRQEHERHSFIGDFYAADTEFQNLELAKQYYKDGIQNGCLYSELRLSLIQ